LRAEEAGPFGSTPWVEDGQTVKTRRKGGGLLERISPRAGEKEGKGEGIGKESCRHL